MEPVWLRRFTAVHAALALLVIASAQVVWCPGFEPPQYLGSPSGTPLSGQDGWQGADWAFQVFTYAHNALELPPNPEGGQQFIGAEGQGHLPPPKALRDVAWSAAPLWSVCYDFCVGVPPVAPQEIGRFALEPATATQARIFAILLQWHTRSTPSDGIDVRYEIYYADGSAQQPPPSPGDAWQRLRGNRWYRLCTTFDFAGNRIVRVAITDLGTGQTVAYLPRDWYLSGGAQPNLPLPTGLSIALGFTPGPMVGNRMGFDNLCLRRTVVGDVNGDGCVNDADLLATLFAFGHTGSGLPEDLNGDGIVDDTDLLIVLFNFGSGC